MTLASSFWELYLWAVLKQYGFVADFTKDRPDFCLPDQGFNIEATIASNPEGDAPEYATQGTEPPKEFNPFNFRTMVRLANSIGYKYQKYQQSYATLAHVTGRPFVLAVSNFNQPWSHLAAQRPIEAVLYAYYVDEDRVLSDGQPGARLEGEELRQVLKENGSPVDLGLFNSPAFEGISAVIFNACATMGKVRALSADPGEGIVFKALRYNPTGIRPDLISAPKQTYHETLRDGLRIYHNPYAKYPLNPAVFRHRDVFQLYSQNGQTVREQRAGQLTFRTVFSGIPETILEDPMR